MSFEEVSNASAGSPTAPSSRGRGRGKSRGGLGKYLRARGRGRGVSRPAEFRKRLVLEDEEIVELEPDSEEAKELAKKYGRRQLLSNADRYAEPEPVLNSEGEEEKEPEVDLSSFLARQRLDDTGSPSNALSLPENAEDESDVDESLVHLVSASSAPTRSHKGKVQAIEWDEELEATLREKEIADANRELKSRFRANTERQKNRQARGGMNNPARDRKKDKAAEVTVEAPMLPTEEAAIAQKSEKQKMEDFLDDLLG